MKSEKEIQAKINEKNKNLKILKDLHVKEKDIIVRQHYLQAKKSLLEEINTLEWVLK